MPVITLTGPRQSGKTTLARACFPDLPYVNLEAPDQREFAMEDPRSFLAQYPDGVILDEVQYVPELFSYIQVISDERNRPGQFILSGSQNFLLLERIAQSLAGRVSIFHLLPLSISELSKVGLLPKTFEAYIFTGSYPHLYSHTLAPQDWYPNYIQTYLERDVRQIINVRDLQAFQRFLKLCAGQVGQLLNRSTLASQTGVDNKTISHWLSVLEASFIIYLLPPHHRNFKKRLVKSPKMYFTDTGLVCNLLGIKSADQLQTHYAKGALFENLVVAEILKAQMNQGLTPDLYFWRSQSGHEVDLLLEQGNRIYAIEIKSGRTFRPEFLAGLNYYQRLAGELEVVSWVVYGGDARQERKGAVVLPWTQLPSMVG